MLSCVNVINEKIEGLIVRKIYIIYLYIISIKSYCLKEAPTLSLLYI